MDLQVVRWEPPVFNTFMNNVCCHDMSKDQVASIELENYPTKILIKERCYTTVPKYIRYHAICGCCLAKM